MLVAFWKAATSFPDIFLFSKTFFFFSFWLPFLFAFVALWKSALSFPAFFFFFCIFKNEFCSSIFCFLFHLLLSHFEKLHPLSSFFHLKFLLITIYFFRAPFSRQPFQMGTNEESSKYLDNKLVKNCSFLLSSEDVVTHRESWI